MPRTVTRASLPARRAPQRTCVGCGAVIAKRDLLRIVRGPEGEVRPDATGKKPGRGAYLHAERRCWDMAIKKKGLERSLKAGLSAQDMEVLTDFAKSLSEGEESR